MSIPDAESTESEETDDTSILTSDDEGDSRFIVSSGLLSDTFTSGVTVVEENVEEHSRIISYTNLMDLLKVSPLLLESGVSEIESEYQLEDIKYVQIDENDNSLDHNGIDSAGDSQLKSEPLNYEPETDLMHQIVCEFVKQIELETKAEPAHYTPPPSDTANITTLDDEYFGDEPIIDDSAITTSPLNDELLSEFPLESNKVLDKMVDIICKEVIFTDRRDNAEGSSRASGLDEELSEPSRDVELTEGKGTVNKFEELVRHAVNKEMSLHKFERKFYSVDEILILCNPVIRFLVQSVKFKFCTWKVSLARNRTGQMHRTAVLSTDL